MNPSPAGSTHNLEMSLREHLIAAGAGQPPAPPLTATPNTRATDAAQHHGLDPSIAAATYPMGTAESPDGQLSESARKGRRELSTSKRAAQNRAAQRAFRQRKEEYIKTLKDQVKDYEAMSEQFRRFKSENNTLRDYIINLQARLIESQGSYPEPPSNIDLTCRHAEIPISVPQHGMVDSPQNEQQQQQQQQQPPPQQHHPPAPTAPMSASAAQQLQQAAAQAAAAQASTDHLNNETKQLQDNAQYLPASNNYPPTKQRRSVDAAAHAAR